MKKLLPLLLLAACTETTSPPKPEVAIVTPKSGVTDPSFKLPEGTGCANAITRLRTILNNDFASEDIGKGVYEQMTNDLSGADKACRAGQDGAAQGMVRNIRVRNGYPAS